MSEEKTRDPHAQRLAILAKEHGEIVHATLPDGQLIAFRRPTQEEWEDLQHALRSGKRAPLVYRELALRTAVEPTDLEKLGAIFERRPALPALLSDQMSDLVGADIEFTVKKG
jgi:hypothetical protein